jgi:hypothetical protein
VIATAPRVGYRRAPFSCISPRNGGRLLAPVRPPSDKRDEPMTTTDTLGLRVHGADAASLASFDTALRQFQCYVGDPVASVEAALAARPDFVMAHVLKAYLHLLGTEPAGLPVAREAHAAAIKLPACA